MNRKKLMRFSTTTFAAIAFAALATAHAQSSSTAPTLQVYSRETVVDVTVIDAKGQPVHGLKQSDFTLKEDGKPQPIRSFKESIHTAPATMQTLPKLPPNVHTNLQPPAASSAVNILLLDFVNTAPGGAPGASPLTLSEALQIQHMVKQDAMKYLHSMPVGTRVAVLGITWPGSLRVLQGVTSDPALLAAAVDTLDYVTDGIGMQRVDMTLELLPQIASVASRIQGRKNLIWFTYGLGGGGGGGGGGEGGVEVPPGKEGPTLPPPRGAP
jgi:VWFA-related protein